MEMFSSEFLSALLAIVIIDLVLAGDNAIVIALAARNLPDKLRTKAVVWGTMGAIGVRTVMTLIVVWLLKIPGLLLVGGALLLWIAYKLLVDQGGDEHKIDSGTDFWAAMKTIVIADAIMGLDNVLAVAGAAHGSFMLVIIGLLISIPIMIAGSQLILKYVQKYPVIVYIGAGVLLWTGMKMITHEPLVKDYFDAMGNLVWFLDAAVIAGILFAGYHSNYSRIRDKVEEHMVDLTEMPQAAALVPMVETKGDTKMLKILVPVDGTENSLQAVRHVITRIFADSRLEVHLLHVRRPFSKHIAQFSSRYNREDYHREMATRALASSRKLLDQHHVPYAVHIEIGEKAETINQVADRLRVNEIVMATSRKNSLTRLLEDSVTTKVIELAKVPVKLIAGSQVSLVEKYGIPTAIGTILAAALVAMAD